MMHVYFVAAITVFAALPVIVLLLRHFGPRWFGAWTAAIIVALVGWFLVNAIIYLSFEDACATLENYGANPPQDIIENCTSDGAARVFGVLLGGVYALIYYAPFLLIYEIARWAWLLVRRRREATHLALNEE